MPPAQPAPETSNAGKKHEELLKVVKAALKAAVPFVLGCFVRVLSGEDSSEWLHYQHTSIELTLDLVTLMSYLAALIQPLLTGQTRGLQWLDHALPQAFSE
jgi:hypothetical protein